MALSCSTVYPALLCWEGWVLSGQTRRRRECQTRWSCRRRCRCTRLTASLRTGRRGGPHRQWSGVDVFTVRNHYLVVVVIGLSARCLLRQRRHLHRPQWRWWVNAVVVGQGDRRSSWRPACSWSNLPWRRTFRQKTVTDLLIMSLVSYYLLCVLTLCVMCSARRLICWSLARSSYSI